MALLLPAACSSTTSTSGRVAESDSAGGAEGVLGSGGPAGSAGGESGAASSDGRASSITTRGGAGISTGRSAGARGPRVTAGRTSQGVTPTTINIGFTTASDFDAASSAFGLETGGGNSSDDAKRVMAVVNYVNAHGGIAGRKVVPIIHDITTLGNFDVEAQAICSDWTEDHKVFAGLAWLYDRETLVSCLAKHNTPVVKSSYQVYTNRTAFKYRNFLYQPDFLFGDYWSIYIDSLVAQGFLKKSNRIGLVRLDDPEHEWTAEKVLKPALGRHGLKLTEEAAVTPFDDASEAAGQTNAQIGNAVLRFRDANVDRVIYIDIGSVLAWFFGTQAESQGYRPKHGVNSISGPAYLELNVPAAQLAGARGVGWWPSFDLTTWSAHNAGERQCGTIMRAAGLDPGEGLSYCSRLFFLKAALDRAHDITPAGLRAAVDTLGTSFSSAITPTTRFWPGRFDGVGAVRDLYFDSGCKCFKYTGSWRPYVPKH